MLLNLRRFFGWGVNSNITGSGGNNLIYTDSTKIWSVFDNIIYNAIKHTTAGGITITAELIADNSVITITDTGCGIAPEHLPFVFERFYRGVAERGTKTGESGLGLYIVKSIMEGCSGNVGIESQVGFGTTVFVTFKGRSGE